MNYQVVSGSTGSSIEPPRFRLNIDISTPLPSNVSRSIPPLTSTGQVYYWTRAWQEGEAEALAELARGDTYRFENADDAIRWLLSEDEA